MPGLIPACRQAGGTTFKRSRIKSEMII